VASGRELRLKVNGLQYRVHQWGGDNGRPVICLHGWMDSGATFAALAASLGAEFRCLAPDWRGFGESERSSDGCYWFPQYLADLDVLVDALAPHEEPVLVGHSMGGNVACLYAGVRPRRVGPVISVEGFGLTATDPQQAPRRYARWLDSLRRLPRFRDFPDHDALTRFLRERNPRLDAERASEIAADWGVQRGGRVELRGDPAHKRPNPVLYRLEEAMACWREVQSPVLWVAGAESGYYREIRRQPDWEERLACFSRLEFASVSDAGHAVQNDQPEALARRIRHFLAQNGSG
jgi:pimeloyl-ACP methyl ester carboxylesterase